MKKKHAMALSMVFTALFALFLVCSPLYLDGDNYGVAVVMAEKFGTEGYCNYISAGLNRTLIALHGLYPAADWFSLYLRLSVLGGCFSLFWILFRYGKKLWMRTAGVLALSCAFLRCLINCNYTQVSGYLMVCSLVWFSLFLWEKVDRAGLALSVFFALLAFSGRSDGALLILPYFAVAILHWGISAFRMKKGAGRLVGILLVLLIPALIMAQNVMVEHSPRYIESVRYDKARQAMEDYPTKPYQDLGEVPFTETQYQLVKRWELLDTEHLNVDTLEAMAAAGKQWQSPGTALRTLYNQANLTKTMLLLALAVSALAVLYAQNAAVLAAVCAGWGGTVIILTYFAVKGRLIERVTLPLLLTLLVLGLLFLLLENEENRLAPGWVVKGDAPRMTAVFESLRNRWIPLLFILGAAILVLDSSRTVTLGSPQLALNANRAVVTVAWTYEEPEDSLYIWDYNGNPAAPWSEMGKLPPGRFLRQNLNAGSWHFGRNYFKQLLEEIKAPNPLLALAERPNTYYMGEDAAELAAYLRETCHLDCRAVSIGEKYGKTIWQFQKN